MSSALAVRVIRPVWRACTRPVGTVRAVATDQPHIVLTYDDGPDPVGTPGVLQALRSHGATATFFVLLGPARAHRSLLDDIVADGHEIGLHGLDHTRLTGLPTRQVRQRCRDGRDELEQLIQAPVRWFRAPFGALRLLDWLAVRSTGLTPVFWGPTPADWRDLPAQRLADDALAACAPGEILLAHDGYAGPDGEPTPTVDRGQLCDLMLSGLAERGLAGRSLSDALIHGKARQWALFMR